MNELTDEQLDQLVLQKMTGQQDVSDQDLDQLVLEKMMSQQTQPERKTEAAIQGFGKGATLGYMPQLQALAAKGVDYISGEPSDIEALEAQGFQVEQQPQESYTELRDKFKGREQALEKQHPIASTAGQLAGGLTAGLAIPAGAAAKGAGLAARTGAAVATGAGMGFLQNPEDVEGEIDPLQLQERLKNAGMGALTGLIAQGSIEGIAKAARGIRAIPNNLKRFSEIKSFKASGAMLKDFRREFGRKKVNDIGRSMLDYKIVSLGDDVADIAKKAEIMRSEVGGNISKLYGGADELVTARLNTLKPEQAKKILDNSLNTSRLRSEFLQEMGSRLKNNVNRNKVTKQMRQTLDDIAELGDGLTLQKWKELRESLDDSIDFAKKNELGTVKGELVSLRNKMQDMAKKKLGAIDDVFGGSRLKEINKFNKDYGNLKTVSDMAKDKVAREEANALMGLRERISGGVGAVVGGMAAGPMGALAGGALGSVATKAMRQYGNPATARIADSLGDILQNNPNLLGKFARPLIEAVQSNPAKFVTTVEAFMADPEFKKVVKPKRRIKMQGQL